MRRTNLGPVLLAAIGCAACWRGIPYAPPGAPRDAGPPHDSGPVIIEQTTSPTGPNGGPTASTTQPSPDAGTSDNTECVADGDYLVLGVACDGTVVTHADETWTFSNHGHTVTAGGGATDVTCTRSDDTHAQLTFHGSVGTLSYGEATWTAYRDSVTCLILSTPSMLCDGSPTSTMIDFDGPY